MSSQEQQSPDAEGQESLELNKEVLQDLDLTPADERNVKGGYSVVYNYNPVPNSVYATGSIAQSARSAVSSLPSGASVSG